VKENASCSSIYLIRLAFERIYDYPTRMNMTVQKNI